MGMFDYVKCEVPLPDGYVPDDGFLQTKDFQCQLHELTITKEGRLIGPTATAYWDDPVGAIVDRNFHGVLRFYDIEGDVNKRGWKWHEY